MSQISQQELQRQLFKLGWTIGQQKRESRLLSEAIPMRLLSMNGQKEEFLEDEAHEALHIDDKNASSIKIKKPNTKL